jgi:hypothetical protein
MSEEVRGFIGPDGKFYRWASGVARAELPIDAPEVPALVVPEAERAAAQVSHAHVPITYYLEDALMQKKGFRVYFKSDADSPFILGKSGFENVTSAKEWFDVNKEKRIVRDNPAARTAVIEKVKRDGSVEHARTYERKRTAWHRVK